MAARAERSGPAGPRSDAMARARVIAELKDPHLLPMHLSEDGLAYEPAPFGGRTLSELRTSATGPPTLSFGLRILLDVLRGLAALHGAKLNGSTLGFVHGEIVPSHIVVGIDGKARLIPLVPAHWGAGPSSPPPEIVGYTAPERLLGDKFDQRADVFSAGVLLWEAIMGEPLFRDRTPDAIVTRLIGGKVPYPVPSSDAPWAVALSDVALGALSVEPKARCAHVGALGAQIENISRGKLATPQELAALVAASMGHGSRDPSLESMPTVRPESPLSGSVHLHAPSSVPAQRGADTLGGATRPSSSSSSVGRTRRAEPAPERPVAGSSGKVVSAASLANTVVSKAMPDASSASAPPSSSSMPAASRASSPSASAPSSSSMPVSAPSSSSMKSASSSASPSSSSMPAAAPSSSALPGPTLVSVVSSLPPFPKSSRAPSSAESDIRSDNSPSVAPVEPARRTAPPPPMTARRQWRIVGTAIAVSFAVAGFAAYALLDWNPVSTANETVLVPPPLSTVSPASPAAGADTTARAPVAANSAAAIAASARPAIGAGPTPRPVAPVPAYRPPVATPVRPAPAPPRPAPPPARPATRPAEGQGKQSETERFGI